MTLVPAQLELFLICPREADVCDAVPDLLLGDSVKKARWVKRRREQAVGCCNLFVAL